MFFLVCEWLNYSCIKCICILENIMYQGRPHDLGGGGQENFFFRFGTLHVAKRHAAHGEAMRIRHAHC